MELDLPEEWCECGFRSFDSPHPTPDSNRAAFVFDKMIERKFGIANSSMDDISSEFSEMGIVGFYQTRFPSDVNTGSYMPSSLSPTDGTSVTEYNGSTVHEYPMGRMEIATKHGLLEARRKTPRFLFRGWCNHPDRPLEGQPELNHKSVITPAAFLRGLVGRDATVYDLSTKELKHMIRDHLRTSKDENFATQFSSWASSLQVAIYFPTHPRRVVCDSCFVSLVDTKLLGGNSMIVHVPSLDWVDPGYPCYSYPHEDLAWGVITGDAVRSIPFKSFRYVFPDYNEHVGNLGVQSSAHRLAAPYPDITIAEVRKALTVAKEFGGDVVVPVVAAILSLRKRDSCLWHCDNIKGLEMISDELGDFKVPEDFCEDETVLVDVVNSGGYGEVEQQILLVRALLHYQHGRGARSRNRQTKAEK